MTTLIKNGKMPIISNKGNFMKIKNLLLLSLCFSLSNIVFADGCNDLLVHLQNNTDTPIYALYRLTQYQASGMNTTAVNTALIPAKSTITLDKLVYAENTGFTFLSSYIDANILFTSINIPGQTNNAYTDGAVEVWKYASTQGKTAKGDSTILSGPVGATITHNGDVKDFHLLPLAKKEFAINIKDTNDGICNTPAQILPGETTIELNNP
jgi:hypothetical protein